MTQTLHQGSVRPALGIDIGGTSVKAAVITSAPRDGSEAPARLTVIGTGKSKRYSHPTRSALEQAISVAVDEALGQAGLGVSAYSAVGLCCPGAVDAESGLIIRSANIPSLEGQSPESFAAAVLHACSPRPEVVVCTDAFAAGAWEYASRGLSGRLLAVSLGTGVGAAVIDDGCVQLVLHGRSSGHFGQMDVSIEDDPRGVPIGPDGGRGSLEAYIGLPALLTMYGDSRGNQGLTDRISGDDPAIRALARALRIAHAIYKPDHITLLGGIGSRLGHVLPELQRLVSTNLTFVAKRTAQVSLASGDHYAAAGCAFIAARPVASVRVAQRSGQS